MIDAINKMPRYWLIRLLLALQVAIFSATSLYQPATQMYKLIAASGGQIYVFVLMLIALIAVLDTIVNDIFPAGWHFKWALRHRHLIYMLLAIGTLMMAITFWLQAPGALGAYSSLGVICAFSGAVAVLDMFARHQS